jgi:hypothetical protein
MLKQELARLHQIVRKYIADSGVHDDEEKQVKLIEIIGSTFIPEELQFIGFMPLKTYIT